MIVAVCPNPAIDRTITLPTLRVGETQRIARAVERAGGKAVNVARVLTEQGRAALVVAPVGGEHGAAFHADLHTSGIASLLVPVGAPIRQTYAIASDAETTNLNEEGGPMTAAEWDALEIAARSADADVLVCSGSLPRDAAPETHGRFVRLAHATGAVAVIDATGPALLAAARAGADVVKPNAEELRATVGDTEPVEGARRLLAAGARTVFVSLGAAGLLAVTPEVALLGRVPHTLAGNTTGAGDAAVAAIAAGIDEGVTLREQLARAVGWSAAAVLEPLAGSIGDPASMLATVSITEVTP